MTTGAAATWGKPSANGPVNVLRQIGGWAGRRPRTASDGSTVINVTGTFEVVGKFAVATGVLEPPPAANGVGSRGAAARSHSRSATATRDRAVSGSPTVCRPGCICRSRPYSDGSRHTRSTSGIHSHEALIPDIRYVPLVLSGIQQATWIVNWTLGDPSDWINGATQQTVNASLVDPTISVTTRRDVRGEPEHERSRAGDGGPARVPASLVARHADHRSGHRADAGRRLKSRDSRRSPHPTTASASTCPISHRPVRPSRPARTRSSHPQRQRRRRQGRSGDDQPRYRGDHGTDSPDSHGFSTARRTPTSSRPPSTARRRRRPWSARSATARHCGSGVRAARRPATSCRSRAWPGHSMSRPQFVTQPAGAVVVAVDGQLKLVDAQNRVHPIPLPSGISSVSAFSIAPDAHRVAFVSGGRLYFSVITVGDPPTMTTAQPIVIGPNLATATSVAWSSTSQLVVGGQATATREDRRAERRRFARPEPVHPGVRLRPRSSRLRPTRTIRCRRSASTRSWCRRCWRRETSVIAGRASRRQAE